MRNGLSIELPSTLFATAESVPFSGAYDVGILASGSDEYRADAPFVWNVRVTNVGGAMLVEGTVAGSLTTRCSRCLADVPIDVSGDVEGYFIIPGKGTAPDGMEADEFDVLSNDHVIDLEPLLNAAVLLETPFMPLCRPECLGLCPTCGANLNDGPCGCAPGSAEPFRENPFAVLKNLDLGVE